MCLPGEKDSKGNTENGVLRQIYHNFFGFTILWRIFGDLQKTWVIAGNLYTREITHLSFPESLEDKDLCSPNFVHQFARRIFDHNQEVLINRHNALIISQTWKDNKSIKRFDEKCSFVVEATPKAGLIINVNQLYLRHNNLILRECYDYLRIYFSDGTKSEKICTPISANTTGIRSFIDPGGRVKVKIRLNDDIRLSPGGETLNLEMVFTQFEGEHDALSRSFFCTQSRVLHPIYSFVHFFKNIKSL